MTEERNNLDPELRRIQRLLETAATDGVDQDILRVRNNLLRFIHSPGAVQPQQWKSRLVVAFAILVPAAAAAVLAASILGVFRPTAYTPVPAGPTPSVRQTSPAALEALLVIAQRASGDAGNVTLGAAPDTVVLTKLDGTVVAKATFKPTERPLYTNAATILPPQVHEVAGAAYYIDGDGIVRRLDRDGHVSTVASFSTTEPQHMTSFAVSPDGSKLMATVFTFGAKGPGLPGPMTIGPSYDNLEYADSGGSTRLLSHAPLAATPGHFMVVGWDQQGPLAGTAVPLGTQNVIPEGWMSPLYHLNMSGDTTDRLGGSDCTVARVADGGPVLCEGSAFAGLAAQVRAASGELLYSLPSDALAHYSAAISPTGDRVAFQQQGNPTSPNSIYGRGYSASIPTDFYSVGWEDGQTLVGYSGDIDHPKLAMIDTSGAQPGPVRIFAVNGFYVGAIQAQ
jgi:hypothetical protein